MTREPTVFVVDDDADLRRAVKWMLRREGLRVETYVSAKDFLDHCDAGMPGCVLLDARMPGMDGLALQQRMAAEGWCTPVIVLSGHADVSMVVRAFENGADSFLGKPFSRHELLDRVHHALACCGRRHRLESRRAEARRGYERLTPREREVMRLVVEGRTTRQMSAELGVSVKTIEIHRSRVMKKMRAESLAALVVLAVRLGMIDEA